MKNLFLSFAAFLFSATKLFAQQGTLDVSFGNKGEILSVTQTGVPVFANTLLVKDNGNILIGSGEYFSGIRYFLQKQYLSNGTPDSSFGNKSEVRTDFGNGVGGYITAMAAIDANEIIAAGIGGLDQLGDRGADILLAKYNDTGKLDSAFGKNGLVVADFGLSEFANCMKLLDNKKILVGGSCLKNYGSKNNFFIARFNADGSVDSSFGNKGKIITDIGLSFGSVINAIAINADGSIIAAGRAEYLSSQTDDKILLAKYFADGKIDKSFGSDGLVFINPSDGTDYANAVAIQDDGKIVAAGVTGVYYPNHAGMCISRYNADGTPDKSFNKTGTLIIYSGNDNAWATSLLIQKDDSYLLGGFKYQYSPTPEVSSYDFALASVTKDGSLNSSFGDGGITTTDFSGLVDYCNAIALQPDGKIVAAGGSTDSLGTIGYITLARYNNDKGTLGIIAKIRRWLQHRYGITWNDVQGAASYIVQRSGDAKSWVTVKRQRAAANNQPSSVNYYEDALPLSGTNYYRVGTDYADGNMDYSNVIAVTNNSTDVVKISPNPANDHLQIKGLLPNSKTTLTVINLNGIIQLQTLIQSSDYSLNIASLKAGNYLLKIEMGDDVITKKFVKE